MVHSLSSFSMLTAVLGLTGAIIFGNADFLGGLAAKRMSSLLVTAVAAASGLVALLIALPFVAGVWSPTAVLWGPCPGSAVRSRSRCSTPVLRSVR